MTHIASCPQCQQDMLLPEGANSETWAKCPSCRAFFQIGEAMTHRELPSVQLVDSSSEIPTETFVAPQKSDDTEPADALSLSDELETSLADDQGAETVVIENANDLEAAAKRIDDWFKSNKTVADATPISPLETEREQAEEVAEEAGIEHAGEADDDLELEDEPTGSAGATIELSAGQLDDLEHTTDFELNSEPERSLVNQPWDDSQQMENLWADIEQPKSDEEELIVEDEMQVEFGEEPEEIESAPITADNVPPLVSEKVSHPRQRSFVRTALMTTVGGILGLGLGYIALLWLTNWLRGEPADFLNVAQYLPSAIVPAEHKPAPMQPIAQAPVPAPLEDPAADSEPAEVLTPETESTETNQVAATEPETTGTETEPAATTDELASEPEATAPSTDALTADPAPATAPSKYDVAIPEAPLATTEPAELAPFDVAAATPIHEASKDGAVEQAAANVEAPAVPGIAEPIHITGAPSFTTDELTAAVQGAKGAATALITGSLSDSREVQQAKGRGYATLSDVAQKVIFVDGTADPDAVTPLREAADQVFHDVLSNAQTRAEVAQIAPRWIASPNRKHGGIFFAATVKQENAGSDIVECQAELEGGQTLNVLAPAALATELTSGKPVGIVGWIVDKPAEQVPGYLGESQQSIWAGQVVPLE